MSLFQFHFLDQDGTVASDETETPVTENVSLRNEC
jgi:hypothetical protein